MTDAKEKRITVPGYVDVHTHGAAGHDISECTETALDAVSEFYLRHGVTAFCPTFVATPLEELDEKLTKLYSLESKFSRMLPAHLEGPYISFEHKGAQPACNISSEFKPGDAKFFEKHKKHIGIVTLCPAVKNATALTSCLVANGIKVQGGHDNSRYPEIKACMENGLDGVTHIFCGCSTSVRGKDFEKYLGLTEAGLSFPSLTVEVIADGKHISKELFDFIFKCKGKEGVMLISDSLSCAGMPIGNYKLGEQSVYTDGKVAYLADKSALAGSVSNLGDIVKLVASYGYGAETAAYMASVTPRKYLSLPLDNADPRDCNVLAPDGTLLETHFKDFDIE